MISKLGLLIVLFTQAPTGNEFYMSVEEIASPLHYSLWKIEVYRNASGEFISAKNYKAKTFKKRLDEDVFDTMLYKLSKLGVQNIKTDFEDRFSSGYYIIEYENKGLKNKALLENLGDKRTASSQASAAIRILENLAVLIIDDLES
jgi:hypothetical protein